MEYQRQVPRDKGGSRHLQEGQQAQGDRPCVRADPRLHREGRHHQDQGRGGRGHRDLQVRSLHPVMIDH